MPAASEYVGDMAYEDSGDSRGVPQREVAESSLPRRIYIQGTGSIGLLVAHSLSKIPNPPPITLLFHRQQYMQNWISQGRRVQVQRHDIVEPGGDHEVEMSEPDIDGSRGTPTEPGMIDNLIIAVKANYVISALKSLLHRLRPSSTVVLMHNGIGTYEDIKAQLYPDPASRPQFISAVITHGVQSKGTFSVIHHGIGSITLGVNDIDSIKNHTPSTRYLHRTLTRTAILGAIAVPSLEFRQLQMDKLAVNAIINPLTAIAGCTNGELLHNYAISRLTNMLLAEISLVLRSLPEFEGISGMQRRFGLETLHGKMVSIATNTADNNSSMLVDVTRGEPTEIDYINGYIVRRGEELGIKCVVNFAVMQMVKAKAFMENQRRQGVLPLEKPLPAGGTGGHSAL